MDEPEARRRATSFLSLADGLRALLRDPVARVFLLLALVLRLGFFCELQAHEIDTTRDPTLDGIFLYENALEIADGDVLLERPFLGTYDHVRTRLYGVERHERLFGKKNYVDSPGYHYFAALCVKLGPRSPFTVVFVQEVLDAFGCALVYVLALRARGLATARLALLASALCLECVAKSGFVLRESLIAFLATSTTLALDGAWRRGSERGWTPAGLLWGAGWLVKLSFSLVLPGVLLLAWLASARDEERGKLPRVGRTAGALARFGLGAALAIAPFAGRNVLLGVPPLRMSTLALVNIAARHNPTYVGLAEPSHSPAAYALTKEIIDSADDTSLGVWRATLARYQNPIVDYPARQLFKQAFFWVDVDFWNNIRCSYLRLLSPWLRLCVVGWGVLGPFAAIGLVLAVVRAEHRRALLPVVLVFVALGPGVAWAGGVYTRYRMVVEPLACVLFATAVVDTARAIRRNRLLGELLHERRRWQSPRGLGGELLLVVALALHVLCADWYKARRPPLDRTALLYYATTFQSQAARTYLVGQAEKAHPPDE